MISKWQWLVLQLTRTLWVRAALFALLGVGAALGAAALQGRLPFQIDLGLGENAVGNILNILASSMLAVTTFSLSVMVMAYAAATNNATPRATRLLMQDTTTQNVLGTFIGTFLFSLVGITALSTGAYDDSGRAILFLVTLVVLLLIVMTILRWIEHLSHFGRVGDTTGRVETVTLDALKERICNPGLGGVTIKGDQSSLADSAWPVHARSTGVIQHLDMAELSRLAEKNDWTIWVECLPGAFVSQPRALAWVEGVRGEDADKADEAIRNAFTLGNDRSFEQDPRFGLSVLAEIASRALSPAVNDPGTAIDVLGRAVRILSYYSEENVAEMQAAPIYLRVHVPALELNDLFDDIFAPIARDGASLLEVQMRLHKGLLLLAGQGEHLARCARVQAQYALRHTDVAMALEEDRQRLRNLVAG
ncbi:DUF2254 domain-containing protein [Halopseudomonas sp.]|uniref:DUF2254 domain-containing protein n=1 Tax=Halopseudomonas sp. TaxID=2901191 RepID=UPI0035693FD1